jgi:hypothetical protein
MSTPNWAPDACTLPTAEVPLREAEFARLFNRHLKSVTRVNATTLDLTLAAEAHAITADLTARETQCCSFFHFELTPQDDDRLLLRIAVPPAHTAVLDGLAARLPQ